MAQEHPGPRFAEESEALIGLSALMRSTGADLAALLERAAANPDPANMLMDMSMICQLMGDPNVAL